MLVGNEGAARRKAMELLIRYAEALGAEDFVDTRNVTIIPGSIPDIGLVRRIAPSSIRTRLHRFFSRQR
jgi:predicted aconitase